MGKLQAGIAEVDYTPGPGLPLMGNYRDDYAARGVRDPLRASCFVFHNSQTRIALLSVDVCMLDRDNVSFMREMIGQRTEIPPQNVLIAATHTHSAPAPMRLGSLPKASDEDIECMLTRAVDAVIEAERKIAPASLGFGKANESRVSFNRRLLAKDGRTRMNWEGVAPDSVLRALGPADPELACLSVYRDGAVAAAAVNFALHPAILAGDNWLYSADYPGYLAEALRRILGAQCTTAFFNGCAGDVNHIDYSDPTQGRGFSMAERVGYMLAAAAQEAISSGEPVTGDTLAVSREFVPLDRLAVSEAERMHWEKVLAAGPSPGQVDGLPDEYWAATRLLMHEKQGQPYEAEVMVVRIGDVAVAGLPGEMFCQYGLAIKERSLARHTLVIELANDAIGYLPTREAFAQGGYEVTPGATFFKEDAGERLTESALRQIERLFQNTHLTEK